MIHDIHPDWHNHIMKSKMSMRPILIKAFRSHAQGHIDKHVANVEVYLHNPVGVGEHPDIMAAIDGEINAVAQAHEKIEVINHYFLGR